MYVLLVYDINIQEKSGQKVLRKTFKACKKYLHHIQNSVFEGELTKSQLEELRIELAEYIRKDVDSVIVFKSRVDRWLEKDFWAKEDDLTTNFL